MPPHRARDEEEIPISLVRTDLLINENVDMCQRKVHVGHPYGKQGSLFIRVRGS
jgi:hypothetical protein